MSTAASPCRAIIGLVLIQLVLGLQNSHSINNEAESFIVGGRKVSDDFDFLIKLWFIFSYFSSRLLKVNFPTSFHCELTGIFTCAVAAFSTKDGFFQPHTVLFTCQFHTLSQAPQVLSRAASLMASSKSSIIRIIIWTETRSETSKKIGFRCFMYRNSNVMFNLPVFAWCEQIVRSNSISSCSRFRSTPIEFIDVPQLSLLAGALPRVATTSSTKTFSPSHPKIWTTLKSAFWHISSVIYDCLSGRGFCDKITFALMRVTVASARSIRAVLSCRMVDLLAL